MYRSLTEKKHLGSCLCYRNVLKLIASEKPLLETTHSQSGQYHLKGAEILWGKGVPKRPYLLFIKHRCTYNTQIHVQYICDI